MMMNRKMRQKEHEKKIQVNCVKGQVSDTLPNDDYQPYSLWTRARTGEYMKFELKDNPDGSVNFEMWQEEARLFSIKFPTTAEFVDLTQRLLVIGSNKEKDDSQRALTVSIGVHTEK